MTMKIKLLFLQNRLSGSKQYIAGAKLGFETTTLDTEGNIIKSLPYDHITTQTIRDILPKFHPFTAALNGMERKCIRKHEGVNSPMMLDWKHDRCMCTI
mmetsp:Transcript_12747/g.18149  ORF Transcript_12747/g.18149 Transcript_12747/m.18149 type:complete len:99 (+) Transcript_12747:99-395(+)